MENTKTAMSEAARKAQRDYKRAWRATHRESVRESNRRYWERRAEKMMLAETGQGSDAGKNASEQGN